MQLRHALLAALCAHADAFVVGPAIPRAAPSTCVQQRADVPEMFIF